MAEGDRQPVEDSIPETPRELLPPAGYGLNIVPPIAAVPAVTDFVPPSEGAWAPIKDFAVLLGVAVAIVLFDLLAVGVAHSLPKYRNVPLSTLTTDPQVLVGGQLASYPLALLLMVALVRIRTGQPFAAAIHWNWPRRPASFFFGAGIVLAFAIEVLSHFLPIPKSLPVDKFFDSESTAYLMAFFGIVVAPLMEELFFRGLLYPLVRRSLGVVGGVLLTAVLFAAIHGAQLGNAWAPVFSIFVVGVALTLVRERTGSVAASFLTHSGYNSALFTVLWFASDHFRHLEKLTAAGVYR